MLALTAMRAARPTAPIRLGFIPLTDCAPLVAAKELGLFKKYGVDVELSKESSWANVRDKVLNGELEGAHCLMSIPLSVYTGIGGKAGSEMKIAMVLNNNRQAITMSKDFCGMLGFNQLGKVAPAVATLSKTKPVTFAMTFPGGSHDVWLRYWLTAAGVPAKSVGIITIPPPQMVANMRPPQGRKNSRGGGVPAHGEPVGAQRQAAQPALGGMKQRVAIARAFAINPSILLLDEPFGALDAFTKGAMHIELLNLWNLDNREKTIVLVTHDIEEAIFLSNRVVVLNNGPASTIREIMDVPLERPRNPRN